MARHHLIPGAILLGICFILSILVSEFPFEMPLPQSDTPFHAGLHLFALRSRI
jgi:hypothetical protein